MPFPDKSLDRKKLPIAEGVLGYFPLAIGYVAFVSYHGNEKHNPGQPLHWSRGKSDDHPDCVARHLTERGTFDADGLLNDGTLAWRALANLQLQLEVMEAQGINIWALHKPNDENAPKITVHTGPVNFNPKVIKFNPAYEVGHAPGHGTATVTIDEHSHGDDHHVRDAQDAQ